MRNSEEREIANGRESIGNQREVYGAKAWRVTDVFSKKIFKKHAFLDIQLASLGTKLDYCITTTYLLG